MKDCAQIVSEINAIDQLREEVDRLELERQRIDWITQKAEKGTQTRLYLGLASASLIQAQRNIHHVIELNTPKESKEGNEHRNGQ